MENPSNDGDSFHVQYRGKEFIFRLYFVDTCEDSEQVPQRVQEQAKTFGITTARVLEAGKVAQDFTHRLIASRPFTVVTRWEDARGASRLPRNYAFVLFGENDEHDLASTLAQNGLVRIYGMPADPPGTVTGAQFHDSLLKLDAQARRQHLGIFGNFATTNSATGSGIAGTSSAPASKAVPASYVPVSLLLPANSHPPDVVDNPADDLLADYAVQVTEAPMPIQTGIKENNYSEIPGWKPSAPPSPAPTIALPASSSPSNPATE